MLKPYMIDAIHRAEQQPEESRPTLHIERGHRAERPRRAAKTNHPQRGIVIIDQTI